MSNGLREQIIDVIEDFTGRNVDDNAVGDAIMTHVEMRLAAERERIAQTIEDQTEHYPEHVWPPISDHEPELASMDRVAAHAMRHAYTRAALIARNGGVS